MTETMAFTPDHDEWARQAFVGSLKQFINFEVEPKLHQTYEQALVPAHVARGNSEPATREAAAALLEPQPLYKLWESLTFHSQNLMWDSVQRTTDRIIDDRVATFRTLAARPEKLGDMRLSEELVLKAPISTTEIHRQPGGYWRERRADDIEQALNYSGTVELYRNAKGMATDAGARAGSDAIGRFIAGAARARRPDLQPRAILDMGCGTGEQTLGYKRVWPDADVTGIDAARPFIRYAHGLAESQGLAMNFAEVDAGHTDFADQSFDLIVSSILFHETSRAQVRDIFKECWRLLRPGGLVLHLDVPYHPHRLSPSRQVTQNWQVRYNGEPFWTGFVELDIRQELIAAGFDADHAFADYVTAGPATYFTFGGSKPQ